MSTMSMSTQTPPSVAGLTTTASGRRGFTNGLTAGAVVIFLILIGLPGGAAAEALPEILVWGILMAVVAAFGVAAARGRTVVERRSQSLFGSLLAGLLVGVMAAAMTFLVMVALNAGQVAELNATRENTTLPNGLPSNINRVQDVFANVNSRSTATMSGMPESAIRPLDGTPRADPTGGFLKMSLLLVLAGTVGGALSYGRHLATLRAALGGGTLPNVSVQRWLPGWLSGALPILLPVVLFALIVINSELPQNTGPLANAYRSLTGGSTQLIGLLASFLLVGAGLVAARSTAGARERGTTRNRIIVLVAISMAFVVIGLLSPTPERTDLMFGQKTPNLLQVAGPDGVQVVAQVVPTIALDTLVTVRRLVILGIGVLLVVWNIISARGPASFRGLIAMNVLLASMAIAPMFLDRYQQSVLLLVGINVMLGIGLNIVVGYTGLLDLGYAAYYAIGAYTYAFAVSNQDIRQGVTVVGLVYGGNDQWIQGIAASFVVALITAPVVVAIGMWLWRRSHPAPAAKGNAATYKARHNRPAWLGYVLVAACVVVVQLVLFLMRGTALYDSFSGFPGFVIGLLLSMIVAASVGTLIGIPVLRLRGDYLAIVTLGFGEIVRLMFNNLRTLTGGPQGVAAIPRISFGPLEMGSSEGMLYVALAGCVIMAFVALRLKSSRVGRAWGAVRSDEDIAQAMGVNPFNMKVFAYGMAAALAGVAGVLFASRQLSIYPENFNLLVSINVLSLVIIGGMGSIPGVIVGALVLIGVPEALRAFEAYRILVFGALLVTMMLLRPQGMLPEPPFPLAYRAKELWQGTKGRAE